MWRDGKFWGGKGQERGQRALGRRAASSTRWRRPLAAGRAGNARGPRPASGGSGQRRVRGRCASHEPRRPCPEARQTVLSTLPQAGSAARAEGQRRVWGAAPRCARGEPGAHRARLRGELESQLVDGAPCPACQLGSAGTSPSRASWSADQPPCRALAGTMRAPQTAPSSRAGTRAPPCCLCALPALPEGVPCPICQRGSHAPFVRGVPGRKGLVSLQHSQDGI